MRSTPPFALGTGPQAVLMVHGLTGSPAELRSLGDFVYQNLGWTVSAPLLPGHATTPADLAQRKAQEWIQTVKQCQEDLLAHHDRVHLIGLSMGACLCLEVMKANPRKIASIVLLAPALWLKTPLQRLLVHSIYWFKGFPWFGSIPKRHPLMAEQIAYDRFPISALREFHRICLNARRTPPIPSVPALIVHSLQDDVVHIRSVEFLTQTLSHPKTQVVKLHHSPHIMTLGREKDQLHLVVAQFYRSLQ